MLAVPQMGHMCKCGTFLKCKMVLVFRFFCPFFCHPYTRKKSGVVTLLSAPKMGQIGLSQSRTFPECHIFV